MTQLVEVPGHGVVEFPDGMSDEQISVAIRKNMMAPQKPASFVDALKKVGGMFVRGGGAVDPKLMALQEASKSYDKAAYDLGGVTTDISSRAGVPPEVAAGLGIVANVGMQAAPSIIGGKMVGKSAAPTLESGSRRLMQSALKPTIQDLRTGKAARAIDTLLKEGVSPTKGGVEKLAGMVDDLGNEIKTVIANSPATVNKGEVGKALLSTYDQFKSQVNPQSDLDTIRKAWLAFRNHPALAGKTEIPVQLAQELKQGTYTQLAKKYGQMGSADIEAQKALARGLKEQISRAVPEVAGLNARQSELINAMNVAERRALMEANTNLLRLAPLAPNQFSFLAMLADSYGASKGLAARGLYAGREAIPRTAAQLGIGALMTESGQPVENEPGALYRFLRGD